MDMITVITKRLVIKRVKFLIFSRAKQELEAVSNRYNMTSKGLEDAILQCCVDSGTKPEIMFMPDQGRMEKWDFWRLILAYARESAKVRENELKGTLEYKTTDEGLQKEAEKLAKVMNAEFKSNFMGAVKQALKDNDTSGIAVIV